MAERERFKIGEPLSDRAGCYAISGDELERINGKLDAYERLREAAQVALDASARGETNRLATAIEELRLALAACPREGEENG